MLREYVDKVSLTDALFVFFCLLNYKGFTSNVAAPTLCFTLIRVS